MALLGCGGIMIFVDICRVTAALVRGCGHHCTVFRSFRSGTPVTANLRKRNMRTGPEQPYSSSVGGVRGARCPCAKRLVGGCTCVWPYIIRRPDDQVPGLAGGCEVRVELLLALSLYNAFGWQKVPERGVRRRRHFLPRGLPYGSVGYM